MAVFHCGCLLQYRSNSTSPFFIAITIYINLYVCMQAMQRSATAKGVTLDCRILHKDKNGVTWRYN